MSPFVSGALGAVAVLFLAAVVRRVAWRRRLGRWRRGAGPGVHPFMLRRLFRRLGTRPDQEATLTAEADALAGALRALRADAASLRVEVADLLAAPALDAPRAREVLDARLAGLDALRARAAEALARVHATLEPAQRERLAGMLRCGPHRPGPAAARAG